MPAGATSSTARRLERLTSSSWDGAVPELSVHIPTYDRRSFLAGLVEGLETQTLAWDRFEVVVVDNGSSDGTWTELTGLLGRTPLRMTALRLPTNVGPAGARNAAVAASRGAVVAFTDDDCLPESEWLEALLAAMAGADVVQGRTEPDHVATGAWDRSIRIVAPTPLFETCNIAYRRSHFQAAGGFPEPDAVVAGSGRRAFGEDVLLGAAAVAAGAVHGFAAGAVVRHRYLPGSYLDHVRQMRNLRGFPALARRSPPLARALWGKLFLTSRSAAFDLGAIGVITALVKGRPALLLATVPWIAITVPITREHGGRHVGIRLAQLAVADAVAAASLVEGSIRHRRPVL